jgi:hypothetical protein
MEEDFFAGVAVQEVELPSGLAVELPVRYEDWSGMMAHFPAPAAKLRELLPSSKLRPALFRPGTGLVTFGAFEYRDAGRLPPYKEFVIGMPVQYQPRVNVPVLPLLFPEWFRSFGLYVLHMPVTTPEANQFGIEVWGYQKFLAEISFEETDNVRRCVLRAEGKDILSLEVEKSSPRARTLKYNTYTVKDGQVLRAPFHIQGKIGSARFGGAAYTLGDHHIAERMRRLRIGEKPAECVYAPQLKGILHPPEERLPM